MKKLFLFCFTLLAASLFSAETTLLLIRHGQTDWNKEDRLQGHSDIPLNVMGRSQAELLAKKMKEVHPDISAIYSSDLSRAYDTALKTARELGIEKITQSPLLRERYHGEAEGLKVEEAKSRYAEENLRIKKTYSTRKERWNHSAVADGESLNALVERVQKQLTRIALENPGKKVAVFAHGAVLNSLIADCLDREERVVIPNCAVAVFTISCESGLKFIEVQDLLRGSENALGAP